MLIHYRVGGWVWDSVSMWAQRCWEAGRSCSGRNEAWLSSQPAARAAHLLPPCSPAAGSSNPWHLYSCKLRAFDELSYLDTEEMGENCSTWGTASGPYLCTDAMAGKSLWRFSVEPLLVYDMEADFGMPLKESLYEVFRFSLTMGLIAKNSFFFPGTWWRESINVIWVAERSKSRWYQCVRLLRKGWNKLWFPS